MTPDKPPVVEFPTIVDPHDWQAPPQIAPKDPSGGPQTPEPDNPLAVPDPVEDSDAPEHDEFVSPKDWDPRGFDDMGDGPFDVVSPPVDTHVDTVVVFDELPVLLSIVEPIYPDLAQRAGIDGTVLVKVLIGRNGKVKNAVAVDGPEVLWSAAVASAKTGLFKPAMQGNVAVEVWVMLPVTFSLNR
jgi:protein TonB